MIYLFISILFIAYIQQSPDSFESKMKEYNLVDISALNSDILVNLKYSTTDNFVGVDMYGDLEAAYFEHDFALKVVEAQRILQERYPEYTLLIYDAARPISVQRAMREAVEDTEFESFVADGTRGGRHNYGVAVDLTIATLDGRPLDMGAGFDDFTEAASVKGTADSSDPNTRTLMVYKDYVNNLAERGIISYEAAANRILLIEVMHEAGLYPYRREWWHFEEIISISATRDKYQLLDF
jgi:D-alanyl-D-alanine dipeptidase